MVKPAILIGAGAGAVALVLTLSSDNLQWIGTAFVALGMIGLGLFWAPMGQAKKPTAGPSTSGPAKSSKPASKQASRTASPRGPASAGAGDDAARSPLEPDAESEQWVMLTDKRGAVGSAGAKTRAETMEVPSESEPEPAAPAT